MGPTIVSQPEFRLNGVAEYLVIDQGDIEKDFSDHSSSLSSSDGDSSMSDDIFSEYQSQSIARRSKENRPQREPNVPHGGGAAAKEYVEEESYRNRRQRNNAAVKRSRDKARQRQKESQRRLAELTAENKRLQMKADVLLKELSLLRGLFPLSTAAAARSLNNFCLMLISFWWRRRRLDDITIVILPAYNVTNDTNRDTMNPFMVANITNYQFFTQVIVNVY